MSDKITACGPACVKPTLKEASFTTQIEDFFRGIFDTSNWPPRWHCGNWSSFHGWLYIFSDVLIGVSYFAIPFLLIRLIKRRPDIPFPKIIWLFVAFIVFCGTTHIADAGLFWWPAYRLSALIRLGTGVISAIAVYALYRVLPSILSLRSVKELETEIKQRLNAEAALNDAHEALLKSHQQLNSFTQILSHNIRNHSSNMSLLTAMVDKTTLSADNNDLVEKLEIVADGLNQTLNDLSEALRVRDQKLPSEKIRFEDIIHQVTGILRREIDEIKVQILTDLAVKSIVFPKIYLESILLNLVSNSIKYRNEHIPLSISIITAINEDGKVILKVKDNGIGFDLDRYKERLFGLYQTFHKHKDAHGIGLFLVKTQVESQGGTITADSKAGVGTTFTITFVQH